MKPLLLLLTFFPFIVKSQTISIATADTIVCKLNTTVFTATAHGKLSYHYQWKINSVNTGIDNYQYFTNSLNNHDTITCQLINTTHDTIFSISNKIIMTVENLPNAGVIIGADTAVCVGASITLTDSATSGIWLASNDHATVSLGIVKGIYPLYNDYNGCQGKINDTILYRVTNSCGIDIAKKKIAVIPMPNAYFTYYNFYYNDNCVGHYIQITSGSIDDPHLCEGTIYALNSVVSVDNFALLCKRVGIDTIINVSTNECGTSTFSDEIVVIDKPRSIHLPNTISELCVGTLDSVKADNILYTQNWYQSNTNTILFNYGSKAILKGNKEGLDTIALSIGNECGFKDTSFVIKVKPIPIIYGIDSVCKDYTVKFEDSLNLTGRWYTNNTDIAVVDSITGIVTGLNKGIDSVFFINSFGCNNYKEINVNECVNIVNIYPNPVFDEMIIHLYVKSFTSYSIINTLGQTIINGILNPVFTKVYFAPCEHGIYFLKLFGENKTLILKIKKFNF